jgi:hypothetical protein
MTVARRVGRTVGCLHAPPRVHPLTVPLIQPLLEHFFCPGRQVSLAFLHIYGGCHFMYIAPTQLHMGWGFALSYCPEITGGVGQLPCHYRAAAGALPVCCCLLERHRRIGTLSGASTERQAVCYTAHMYSVCQEDNDVHALCSLCRPGSAVHRDAP